MSIDLPSFQLMLHCLEHVTPCNWSDFINQNAKTSEIRDQTLRLVESHEKSDHWLPRADEEARISICDQWEGVKAEKVLSPGDQFAEHDIELNTLIGRGTANLIFKAQQIRVPSNQFAIKTPSNCNHPQKRYARFVREYNIHRKAEHPNVVRIFSYGKLKEDQAFLAMEYLDGIPFGQFLLRSDYSVETKFGLLTQACSTIADLHDRGITHGDMSPDNLVVTQDQGNSHLKLIDFGKAICLETTKHPPSCATNKIDDLPLDIEKNRRRDIRAIAYLLYSFLSMQHHAMLLEGQYGRQLTDELISLQSSIQWEGDASEISDTRTLTAEFSRVAERMDLG